jgi:hypothetical protein
VASRGARILWANWIALADATSVSILSFPEHFYHKPATCPCYLPYTEARISRPLSSEFRSDTGFYANRAQTRMSIREITSVRTRFQHIWITLKLWVTLYSFLKIKVEWALGKYTCLSAFLKISYLNAILAFIWAFLSYWSGYGSRAGEEMTLISENPVTEMYTLNLLWWNFLWLVPEVVTTAGYPLYQIWGTCQYSTRQSRDMASDMQQMLSRYSRRST